MPIWAAIISTLLMTIAGLIFVRAFYFHAKVILNFQIIKKRENLGRIITGPWSDRELKLRTNWLRALLHVVIAFGIVILWVIGISAVGLNGPLNCTLNENNSAYFLNNALKGIVCPAKM